MNRSGRDGLNLRNLTGLRVSVLRNMELGDCSLGGITSIRTSVLLVDTVEGGPVTAKEGEHVLVVLRREHSHGPSMCAEPATVMDGELVFDGSVMSHAMGGNHVGSSDGRFSERYGASLKVHDRDMRKEK